VFPVGSCPTGACQPAGLKKWSTPLGAAREWAELSGWQLDGDGPTFYITLPSGRRMAVLHGGWQTLVSNLIKSHLIEQTDGLWVVVRQEDGGRLGL